jgi:hypothetical protein
MEEIIDKFTVKTPLKATTWKSEEMLGQYWNGKCIVAFRINAITEILLRDKEDYKLKINRQPS